MGEPAKEYTDEDFMQVDPWCWAKLGNLQLPDSTFKVEGNEPQIGYMQSEARRKCVRKATQFAFTTSEVIDSLHGCRYGYYPKGVLYLFPTRNDVADFSSSRFKPILSENHDLIGRYVKDTDRENLKRIGRSFLFFRSGSVKKQIEKQAKSSASLKSVPADKCVFDEYDEMDPGARKLALARMGDSSVKKESYLANPTLPDYGIDNIYENESDRRVWLHKCVGCRSDQVLELTFPDCLQRRKDGRVARVCIKCGHELDPRTGQWVARNTDRSDYMEGYWISHLNKIKIDPAEILNTYENLHNLKSSDVSHFWNLTMGVGHVDAKNRLTKEQVLDLCEKREMSTSSYSPCYMGVDQNCGIHLVIVNQNKQIVKLDIVKEWEELYPLMDKFKISCCVVDAEPEMRNARKFSEMFPGRVWLNFYNFHQKGSYKWNEREYTVQGNRTETLDNSHKVIENGEISLPSRKYLVCETFAEHMHNCAKRLEEDPETGSQRYVYIKLGGEDHFRHAFNYVCMAFQSAPDLLYPGF